MKLNPSLTEAEWAFGASLEPEAKRALRRKIALKKGDKYIPGVPVRETGRRIWRLRWHLVPWLFHEVETIKYGSDAP